jgi:hypothetical protein
MTLQQGEILGYDYNRMVVQFTMFDQSKVVQCAVTTAALDDIERIATVKADGRIDQFVRLRTLVQERANQKHADGFMESGGRLVLRSEDFNTKS